MTRKIEIRKVDDLVIHAALKTQPRLTDEELLSWRRGMKRRGEAATPPIYITQNNEIVDGRHRWWCVRKLGWRTIPVEVVPDDEIYSLIFETIANRRHYTKGQLAYIIAPMIEDVFAEAKKRMLAGPTQTSLSVDTPETVAADLGISTRVLHQAQEIHKFFQEDKTKRTLTDRDEVKVKNVTFREFFEPRIMMAEDPESPRTRAYGLGAVLAGIKQILSIEKNKESRPHSGGRPEKVEKQLKLFSASLSGFKTKFDYWQKWDEDTRSEAAKGLPPVFEDMPDDLLEEFLRVIVKERKRRGSK